MDRVAWLRRWAWGLGTAAGLIAAGLLSARAQIAAPGAATVAAAPAATPACVIPAAFSRFEHPLRRSAHKLSAGTPIKIVAIGSSSTFGAGASKPYYAYPSRLAAELSREFVDHEFTVLNRGVNGDTAADMLWRFERGVIAEEPDLVLWQVGTNSLLRGDPIYPHWSLLQGGIARLRSAGADVVLIDPQYAPRVLARPNTDGMVALIEQTAKLKGVNLFRRFALMRHWHQDEGIVFDAFLAPDGLHLNDFSYGCIARALGLAIAEAMTRPVATASAPALKR
ncbi:MAG: SGNH/GDSL hydrolase family protein [Hyphomicrobiales bacterium]|nr:SGNH/GDSL hydrolase family protein [Hyphomicrobiales bacterium]